MRRLRALLLTGIFWALFWLPIGIGLAIYGATLPKTDVVGPSTAEFLTVWMGWGALSGVVFALTLMIAERRRTLQQLSITRIAVWGGLGSMTLPLVVIIITRLASPTDDDWILELLVLAFSAALGAACAAWTLAMARRASEG